MLRVYENYGPTSEPRNELFLTVLEKNLLNVNSKEMNTPFKLWKNTLKEYNDFYGGNLTIERL
jgi:hypothetical protein